MIVSAAPRLRSGTHYRHQMCFVPVFLRPHFMLPHEHVFVCMSDSDSGSVVSRLMRNLVPRLHPACMSPNPSDRDTTDKAGITPNCTRALPQTDHGSFFKSIHWERAALGPV